MKKILSKKSMQNINGGPNAMDTSGPICPLYVEQNKSTNELVQYKRDFFKKEVYIDYGTLRNVAGSIKGIGKKPN